MNQKISDTLTVLARLRDIVAPYIIGFAAGYLLAQVNHIDNQLNSINKQLIQNEEALNYQSCSIDSLNNELCNVQCTDQVSRP